MPPLNSLLVDLNSRIDQVTYRVIEDVRRRIVLSLRGQRTGRTYRRGGVVHRASAPGEAPATDRGFLVNSVQVVSPGPGRHSLAIGAVYAEGLEKGNSRVAARPFVEPAIIKTIEALGARPL